MILMLIELDILEIRITKDLSIKGALMRGTGGQEGANRQRLF